MQTPSWRPQPVDFLTEYGHEIVSFFDKNRLASAQFVGDKRLRDDWFGSHRFRPTANVCIDERVQDFDEALGLPIGIPEFYRAGGSKSSLSSLPYARRCLDGITRLAPVVCDGSGKPDARGCADRISRLDMAPCESSRGSMVEMRMVTAHYSAAHPTDHSCAAWDHQTHLAIDAMKERAADLNFAFPGRIVAFPVLIDTDLDAIRLIGVGGQSFDVREEISKGFFSRMPPEGLVECLKQVYPMTWEPLQVLDVEFRSTFHQELAERVLANERYVRHAFGRPPELLDHKGELVFVGRHADWVREHNSLFLIDDTEDRNDVLANFALALKYVSRNVIRRAIVERNDEWIVPVVINIPYDGEMDERVSQLYAHKLQIDLARHAGRMADEAVSWILHGPHAIVSSEIPDRVFRQIYGLPERFTFVTSVSRRCDRLFRPFQ